MIKSFNDFYINEKKLLKSPSKKQYTGEIVDKERRRRLFGGYEYIIYVKIPYVGVEDFKVDSDKYYDYKVGQIATVSMEEFDD